MEHFILIIQRPTKKLGPFKQEYSTLEWDVDFIVEVKFTTVWLDRGLRIFFVCF